MYCSDPKVCPSHPSPEEQCLLHLSHSGQAHPPPFPRWSPKAIQTCSEFTCSSIRFRKKGGQSEAKRELQSQIGKETLRVGRESLNQLVSTQGKGTVWGRGRWGSSHPWLGSNALSVTPEFQRETGRWANHAPLEQKPDLGNWKPAGMMLITSKTLE